MQTRLYRQECLNPFYYDGKEINTIYFYEDGNIIASTKWLGSNNPYNWIEFPFEINNVKARTLLNLNRVGAFIVLNHADKYSRDYNLYIHTSMVKLNFVRKEEYTKTWYMTGTQDVFSIELYGNRRKYGDENGRSKYGYNVDTYKEEFSTNVDTKNTAEWNKCSKMAEEMKNAALMEIDATQVHRLLEHYNITKKRVKK